MSDVDDWSGVSAGATTLAASGIATPTNHLGVPRYTIEVDNLPATTRSLLFLVLPLVVSVAAETYALALAQGATTKQTWQPLGAPSTWEAQQGGANPIAGVAMAPLYFPAYGLVDPTINIAWSVLGGNLTDQVQYWVLAMPDADLNGSTFMGMTVTNPLDPGNSAVIPLQIAQATPASLQATVTPAAGAVFETGKGRLGSGQGSVPLSSTGPHTLINAPAAGLVRIVDFLFFSGGTTITVGLNGGSNLLPVTVNTPVWGPGFVLASGAGGLTFNNTATGGNAYASWHDENA